ncbi:MAG: UDP-N-acetylmuramate dehydrogenase [Lachnospiraceae bacterium]|nr:UDP-N-acetylmuramate dehydrogenase [Lachnospiraceae bacterium]
MSDNFFRGLQNLLEPEQCCRQEAMSSHITFRVGGPAEYYVRPGREQIPSVLSLCKEFQVPWMVIGNGSNLLVGDKGIPGLVIEIGKNMNKITVKGNKITAEAGTLLSAAACCAADHGLTGMEFASGIPGSIGGAVVMNAGAYGGEMKHVLTKATVLTLEGEEKELTLEELDLGYRHSCILKNRYIVLDAEIQLEEGKEEEIRRRMTELRQQRNKKQPLEYPSAGSTFKRPEGYFAGKLIQDTGLQGYQVGGAQISEKHCGFVINREQATAAEVRQLISDVQDRVEEKFGVRLEPEVKFIGEF